MNKRSGFTLVEVIIVLGITGLISLVSIGTLKMMMLRKKRESAKVSQKIQMRELKKLASRLKNVSWPSFYNQESYFLEGSEVKKVTWSLSDTDYSSINDITFLLQGKHFKHSSHSIEVANLKLEKGLLFSRCVARSFDEKSLDFSRAYDIDLVPIISFKGKLMEVYCCPKGRLCSDNKISNSYSTHRVMSFFVQQINQNLRFRRFPQQPFKRKEHGIKTGDALDGVGIIFLFNRKKYPDRYSMYIFSQMNRCYIENRGRECDGVFDTNYLKIKGNSKFSVDETGVFDIR